MGIGEPIDGQGKNNDATVTRVADKIFRLLGMDRIGSGCSVFTKLGGSLPGHLLASGYRNDTKSGTLL